MKLKQLQLREPPVPPRAPVTSQSDEWETPQWLFDALNHEFGFTLDGAATKENTKCAVYNTRLQAIGSLWDVNTVFCNPPYSNIKEFVDAALLSPGTTVLLLPAGRTDNDWFHRLTRSPRATFRYFRKRVAFISDGVAMKQPPFTPMVVIVNGAL